MVVSGIGIPENERLTPPRNGGFVDEFPSRWERFPFQERFVYQVNFVEVMSSMEISTVLVG